MPSLAHNLAVRRDLIRSCWAGVTIGWIGDAAHQSEQSDHNPDAAGIVHAIDVMVTGARAAAVVEWCLRQPADLEYLIHNRTIWTRANGWKPKRYTGTDPHTNHVHISGRHGTSGRNAATGTGYDLGAAASTPTGAPCRVATPKPPAPKPPAQFRPGSRALQLAKPPMSGADVRFVQRFIGPRHAGAADGVYGPHTAAGVRWYQSMRGGSPTGHVGPWTWHEMGIH